MSSPILLPLGFNRDRAISLRGGFVYYTVSWIIGYYAVNFIPAVGHEFALALYCVLALLMYHRGYCEIANKIRRLRFDNWGMTQQELANRFGVTRQTVIALEAEKYVPSLELALKKITEVFKVGVVNVFL